MFSHFGDCELDDSLYQLRRGGEPVDIEPKVFDVLVYLLHHRDRLISKEELLDELWPGQVVSETALTRCIVAARKAVGDDGGTQQVIKTQHGRGYRFVAPLITNSQAVPTSTFQLPSQEEEISGQESGGRSQEEERRSVTDQPLAPSPQPLEIFISSTSSTTTVAPRRFRWWQVLVLVALLVIGGVLTANWRLVRLVIASYTAAPVVDSVALPLPDKPSLVVLPLVNLSGDAAQEYFSDGLTDDLINTLAQFPDLFIIARHSAFTYKGKTIKEQDVGRELGVRYVLEGSVRRAGEQVRLNVQLVDATNGEQLWAERYDRPFTEIFALQDDLVHKIATTLTLQLSAWAHGVSARKATENVEAYDYELRGLEQWLGMTKKDNLRAREFFEKAVGLDPQYAEAYSLIGITYYTEWSMYWNRDPQTLERAVEYGQKAVALNDFYFGHLVMALAYTQQAQVDRALSEIERVITLQPNRAESHYVRGEVLMFAGRPREALPSFQHALRLSPRGPINYFAALGWVYHATDQYAESIAAYKRTLALNPLYPWAYPTQAFNYLNQWITQQSHDPKILDQAYDAAQNGVALNDAYRTALGVAYLWQKQYDNAIVELERAVKLDGNSVCAQMQLAYVLGRVGRVEEAVRVGERSLSLQALPADDRCLSYVADAFALAGRLEEAAALFQRQLRQFPNLLGAHLLLAGIYSQLSRDTEARAQVVEVLRINPQFSLEVHKQRAPFKDPAMLEHHIAALREAGLK